MGAVAALIGRSIPHARPRGWLVEAFVSVATAVAAGLAATALDFGGWKEPDWRAGVFALACALGAIGITRLVRMKS